MRVFFSFLLAGIVLLPGPFLRGGDYNALILRAIERMPSGGTYARYRRDLPEERRFDDLYTAVEELNEAFGVGLGGALKLRPEAAAGHSFCSSATYLLFAEVIGELQRQGVVPRDRELSRALADIGPKTDVIHGKRDGVGLFGHWNANGPGTAVLFARLDLGTNFTSFAEAKPGDFLKIFWNEKIGKGERGHLVVYLGENESGDAIRVWSSQTENENGSAGYGWMWVEKSRIVRAVFSRLERPENLVNWLAFSPEEETSDYLVGILETGSTGEAMLRACGIRE